MAGELITTDHQYEFRGRLFGAGTATGLVAVEGLEDLAPVRASDLPRSGRAGTHPGQDLPDGRVVTFTFDAHAAGSAAFRSLLDAVAAVAGPTQVEHPLVWQHHGQKRRLLARCRRRAVPVDRRFGFGWSTTAIELVASDPVIYDNTERSGSTGFPAGGTGFTFPLTFPFVFGSAGTGGVISAPNDGNVAVGWTATITGPWVNPTIRHVASGRQLTINVSLAAGEVLTVDAFEQAILLGGTASRFSSLVQPATWFLLDPGPNEVRFGGASGTGTAVLKHRSGWL